MYYDTSFSKIIPSEIFYFIAIGHFIYQTLDAVDGKQARKTKSSSPLGQLFDHGCDSFGIVFFIYGVLQALLVKREFSIAMLLLSQQIFWCGNWSENHTHVLKTNFMGLGVTEVQTIVYMMLVFTGYYGQGVWKYTPTFIAGDNELYKSLYNSSGELIQSFLDTECGILIYSIVCGTALILLIVFFIHTLVITDRKIEGALQWIPNVFITQKFDLFHFDYIYLVGGLAAFNYLPEFRKIIIYSLLVIVLSRSFYYTYYLFTELADTLGIYVFKLGKKKEKSN